MEQRIIPTRSTQQRNKNAGRAGTKTQKAHSQHEHRKAKPPYGHHQTKSVFLIDRDTQHNVNT